MRSALMILIILSFCFGAAQIDSMQIGKIRSDSISVTAIKFARGHGKADSSKHSAYADSSRAAKISDSTKKVPTFTVTSTSNNLTFDATHQIVTITAAAKTIRLPTAVGATGRFYAVDNASSGDDTVRTILIQSLESDSVWILPPNSCMDIFSDGTNWRFR